MKPRIGIIPGDPGGIGPELIAKLLADPEVREKADILLIGDRHLFEMGQAQAGAEIEMVACDAHKGDCCLLYTSPSPRDYAASRMPSSA